MMKKESFKMRKIAEEWYNEYFSLTQRRDSLRSQLLSIDKEIKELVNKFN